MNERNEQPEVRTRRTARSARYYLLGTPPSLARHVCFVLHGYGQLAARMLRHFQGGVPDGLCIVAPEALSRFYLEAPRRDGAHLHRAGASWLTREDRESEIADALEWLELVRTDVFSEVRPDVRCSVFGFSQGVATAMRWLVLGKLRPEYFIAWAGSLAMDLAPDAIRSEFNGLNVVFVAGNADEFADDEKVNGVVSALREHGAEVELLSFSGGHVLDPALIATLLPRLVQR